MNSDSEDSKQMKPFLKTQLKILFWSVIEILIQQAFVIVFAYFC